MSRRIVIVALIVGTQIIGAAGSSKADTGWAYRKGHWVEWSFKFHAPPETRGRTAIVLRATQREAAIRTAVLSHSAYVKRLRAALRAARAIVDQARAAISNGFPAQCVAMAEEGGHNSTAGYFGFIYSPSSYGASEATYGASWLNWPYSAQLAVALDLFRRYGGSAWGPLTRSKCGI